MKYSRLLLLFLFSILNSRSLCADITYTDQSRDIVAGDLGKDEESRSLMQFSVRREGDFIEIELSVNGKSVIVRKSPSEMYVTGFSPGVEVAMLQEDDKRLINSLANELDSGPQESSPLQSISIKTMAACILRHLASWPPDMPLSLSMDAFTITIGEETVSRAVIDETRNQAMLHNLPSSIRQDIGTLGDEEAGWNSLCRYIGAQSNACYPTSLKPLNVKCDNVLIGGRTCRGRCGAGCNGMCDGFRYTQDCFNHDQCADVLGISHRFCNFIFPACSDDCLWAPSCANVPGVWIATTDFQCDGKVTVKRTWNLYPDLTFTSSSGDRGNWDLNGWSLIVRSTTGWKPRYKGTVSTNGLYVGGNIINDPNGSCWSAKKTSVVLPLK